MRWRLVDRVTAFEPWCAIAGAKAVSLEEYYLLEPLGRQGVLPEALVIECCVELVRWLVAASSSFEQGATLTGIEGFAFRREVGIGELLRSDIRLNGRREEQFAAECRVASGSTPVASGRLTFALTPLDEWFEPEELAGLWQELHGAA